MFSSDKMRIIAHRWIEEGWQKGNQSVVDELHSIDFVDHDSAGRSPNNNGFKEGIASLYAAFPDFLAEVQDLVIDSVTSKVVVRWSASGTHTGKYLGVQPSGKRIAFKGIEIIRIKNNQIVERWGEWDAIDLLEQLGRL